MKKILTIALLALSFTVWSQNGLRLVDPNVVTYVHPVAQMTVCLPIVEANDSTVILICAGIRIEMPMEKMNGKLTIIIHGNTEETPLEFIETVNWFLAPNSYYRDSLGIDLK